MKFLTKPEIESLLKNTLVEYACEVTCEAKELQLYIDENSIIYSNDIDNDDIIANHYGIKVKDLDRLPFFLRIYLRQCADKEDLDMMESLTIEVEHYLEIIDENLVICPEGDEDENEN